MMQARITFGWLVVTMALPSLVKAQQQNLDDLLEMEPVVVQSTPIDTSRIGGSAHVVSNEELETFEYDDVHRVLNQVPGVYVRQEDAFGLRPNIGMRGASSDRSSKVTLMEDGVLLAPAPYSAPAAYFFPLITRMERLEVFKGPASIQFGPNTIGGALNWISRPIPVTELSTLDVAVGQYRTGKLHGSWGARNRHLGALVEGLHLRSDGFKDLDGGGNTGFAKNEFIVKLQANTDVRKQQYQAVELRLGYADERSSETYLGLTDADFSSTPYRRYVSSGLDQMNAHRTQVQLRHLLKWGNDFSLNTTFYRHDFSRKWRKLNRFRNGPSLSEMLTYPTGQAGVYLDVLRGDQDSEGTDQDLMIGTNDRSYISQGVQLVGNWRQESGWLSQEIELGVRFHDDSIRRHHTEDGYQMRSAALVSDQQGSATILRNEASTFAWAFHVLDKIQLGESWFVNPGLRLELIDWKYQDNTDPAQSVSQRDTYAVFIPGIGVVYQPFGWLGFLAGVHRGFSPAAPGPADNVDPERSTSYEAGVRFGTAPTQLELIGFFNDYSNLTAICSINRGCTDAQVGTQINAGSVYVGGLESSVTHEIELVRGVSARGRASYTLTLSEFQSSFQSSDPLLSDVDEGDRLPYVPVHQGAAMLGIATDLVDVSVSASYVGEMRDVAGQGNVPATERISDYLVMDLAGSVNVTETDQLYLRIDNLLDNEYMVSRRPFGARPGLPFQLMLGYKGSFR